MSLPARHQPHTDKYFLHARAILDNEGLDPQVTMQVFLRDGPGVLRGVNEAVEILHTYSSLEEHGGRVFALPEGENYLPLAPVMLIHGPLTAFIELETMYLGVLSSLTSQANDGAEILLPDVQRRAERIRELLPLKQLSYFGARHWHWRMNEALSKAAIRGGFDSCSTDAGAHAAGLPAGVGTIPHALILPFSWKFGKKTATIRAVAAFDRAVDPALPRIALVDTFNREVDDSLAAAEALGDKLWGVRIDTAADVLGQGGAPFDGRPYWTGHGVTVESVRAVRDALDRSGFENIRIALSSGFGGLDKIKAFADAEKQYGRLFDAVGIGGLFSARFATADIVRIEGVECAKIGRRLLHDSRLVRVL